MFFHQMRSCLVNCWFEMMIAFFDVMCERFFRPSFWSSFWSSFWPSFWTFHKLSLWGSFSAARHLFLVCN
jgi:hypothetical protein